MQESKKCVVACLDPNPLVSGKGVEILKKAGITVEIGCLKEEAKKLNRAFFKYITCHKAYLFLKCAITLDGKIACSTGKSKWISNDISRARVQELRNKYTAIMVGVNTINTDNPSLKCKMEKGRNPVRVVIDPELQISMNASILNFDDGKNIVVTYAENQYNANLEKVNLLTSMKVDMIYLEKEAFNYENILKELAKRQIDGVLLEGGSHAISKAFKENAIDEGEIFIAPKILGDEKAISVVKGRNCLSMDQAINLENTEFHVYGNNVSLTFLNNSY